MISTANLVTLILLIRFLLSGHPISGGQRWSSDAVAVCFSDDDHLELDLVDAKATSSGVVIATYRTNV